MKYLALLFALALPAAAQVAPGTTRASPSFANAGAVNGTTFTASGRYIASVGLAGTPSYTFSGSLTTGFYGPAADTVYYSVGGTPIFGWTSGGHTVFPTDNTFDFGTASLRPRTGYFGTSLVVAGTTMLPTLTGTSASLGGGALLEGACASNTTTVTGAATTMAAVVTPNTYPGDGSAWSGQVTSANTVTTRVCAIVALTPTASTYNIRVIQ